MNQQQFDQATKLSKEREAIVKNQEEIEKQLKRIKSNPYSADGFYLTSKYSNTSVPLFDDLLPGGVVTCVELYLLKCKQRIEAIDREFESL